MSFNALIEEGNVILLHEIMYIYYLRLGKLSISTIIFMLLFNNKVVFVFFKYLFSFLV